jgi:hypothetical protein
MQVGALGMCGVCVIASACGDASRPAEAQTSKTSSASSIELVDVAARAGLDLVQVSGDPRRWYIPESNGTGAAWLDYDGDGDMDLFIGNGQGMRYVDDGKRLEVVHSAHSALYRNDADKHFADDMNLHFTDVSAETGCARSDWIQAIAVGDVDNDGDPDIYLACFGGDVFLRNDGGHFVDATKEAGLGNRLWGAGAALADVNNDGALDLYVANYCIFDCDHPPLDGKREVINGVEVGWGPEAENKQGFNVGAPDVFYLGDGKGHFREATRECGLELAKPLCSYAVVFSDVNNDGWQDILVANDMQPANLFINDKHGHFTDEAVARGFAYNAEGKATASMGMTVEDFDGDGDMDVFRTNFDGEANSLLVNDGQGNFRDEAMKFGLAAPSIDKLGWACGFFDVDCDGDLDLLVANGHVYPQGKQIGMSDWLMPTQLYEAVTSAQGSITYRDITAQAGSGLAPLRSARGIAFADADNDGDVDAVVIDLDQKPRLLENRSEAKGHWISVYTTGGEGTGHGGWSNRDGIGAKVRVTAGGRTWLREARTTQGLYSSHDPRLFFGLGNVDSIDSVEVLWSDGTRSVESHPPVDEELEVIEEVWVK